VADGFLYAIGYAGLAATIWAAIVPALLARASRKRFGSPQFRVWGGTPMIVLILLFGAGNGSCISCRALICCRFTSKARPSGGLHIYPATTPATPLSPASLNQTNAGAPDDRRSGR
jgi:hypothetical protein